MTQPPAPVCAEPQGLTAHPPTAQGASGGASPVGLFISFEGIDGAGKSSHIATLAEAFRAQGRSVALTREPGGTPLAEKLRALLLTDAMDPLCEALLMFAARRDHLRQVIEPALARGEVVISDRFTDATFAYQGGGRGFDWAVLSTLEGWVQALPAGARQPVGAAQAMAAGAALRQPDLTLWFDLPPAVAAARLQSARAPDKFEAEGTAFFERVVAGYQRRCQADPARFARIGADQPLAQVWAGVLAAVCARGLLVGAVA